MEANYYAVKLAPRSPPNGAVRQTPGPTASEARDEGYTSDSEDTFGFALDQIRINKRPWDVYVQSLDERNNESSSFSDLKTLAAVAVTKEPIGPPAKIQRLRPRRKLKRFDLPLLFPKETEAVKVLACPDSGSDENIISEDVAKELGLDIKKADDDTKHFSLANGKIVCSVGQVTARFSFALGTSADNLLPECIFNVFRSLAVSVIMGMDFLQQTETLTKHTDRMVEQLVPSLQALRVNSVGKAKRNVICRLGTYTSLASPDTGSDLDLVSPDFARARSFDILEAKEELQFADCSIGYTSGVIQAAFSVGHLDDCAGFKPKGITQMLEFHVLDNLTADILLGQETIESLDIFNLHADLIIPSIGELGQSDVNIIRHIGAFEAFCSKTLSKLRNRGKDETSTAASDPIVAIQRRNARRDTTLPIEFEGEKFGVDLSPEHPTWSTNNNSNKNPHSGLPAEYVCTFPGCTAPSFRTQYHLNSHSNIHSSIRLHLYCPVAGCSRSSGDEGFKRNSEMIRHGRVHGLFQEGPGYICPFCLEEHKFAGPDILQRHLRVIHHVDIDHDDPVLREV